MTQRKIILCTAGLLLASCAMLAAQTNTSSAQPTPASKPVEVKHNIPLAKATELGRKYTEISLNGDVNSLWPVMNSTMQDAMKSAATLKVMQEQVTTTFGKVQAVLGEYTIPAMPEYVVYIRRVVFANANGKFVQTMSFDSESKIAGMFIVAEKNP